MKRKQRSLLLWRNSTRLPCQCTETQRKVRHDVSVTVHNVGTFSSGCSVVACSLQYLAQRSCSHRLDEYTASNSGVSS